MFKYEVAGSRCKTFDQALKLIARNLKESTLVTCRIEADNGSLTEIMVFNKRCNSVFVSFTESGLVLTRMLQSVFESILKGRVS